MTRSADEILTSLEDKYAQQAELRRKLEGSLMVEEVLGKGCFKHGKVRVGARATVADPHLGTITFTLGNGEVIEKPAKDVPFKLWPTGLQEDLRRMDPWKRKHVERKLGISL